MDKENVTLIQTVTRISHVAPSNSFSIKIIFLSNRIVTIQLLVDFTDQDQDKLIWKFKILFRIMTKLSPTQVYPCFLENKIIFYFWRFGYCGKGEGFCTPATRSGPADRANKAGAGCSLEQTQIVGGDLPRQLGGGGIKLDRDSPEFCFSR